MIKRIVAHPTVLLLLLATCTPAFPALADDDTYVQIQEMVNDLGGPALQKKNNGKVSQEIFAALIRIENGNYIRPVREKAKNVLEEFTQF